MGSNEHPFLSEGTPTVHETSFVKDQRLYPDLSREDLDATKANIMAESRLHPQNVYDNATVIEVDGTSGNPPGPSYIYERKLEMHQQKDVEIQRQQSKMGKVQDAVTIKVRTYSSVIKNVVLLLLLGGYFAYFTCALIYSVDKSTALIVLTCLTVFGLVYSFISEYYGEKIYSKVLKPLGELFDTHWTWAQW